MTRQILEFAAVLAATLFAGAATYINAVEHPARLSCGTSIAVTQWVPSYRRATVMQASLATVAALSALARGLLGEGRLWLWGATAIFAVIPFTLIVILPTSNRLHDPSLKRESAETQRLLVRWGRLHAVRSILGVIAAILFIWAAVG
jgi:hypothetical protein